MATKRQFIELVQHELTGGNMTPENMAKYHEEVISERVSYYFDAALLNIWLQQKASKDFRSFDTWSKFYPSLVLVKDEYRNEYYTELPITLSSIPNSVAVREVTPKCSKASAMCHIEAGSWSVFSKFDLGTRDQCFYVEHNRVYFPDCDGYTEVGMRLVVPFSQYADDDQIPQPVSMRGTLFDVVIQSFRGQQVTPQDKVNNNEQISQTK